MNRLRSLSAPAARHALHIGGVDRHRLASLIGPWRATAYWIPPGSNAVDLDHSPASKTRATRGG
jgi:hypothetical protein